MHDRALQVQVLLDAQVGEEALDRGLQLRAQVLELLVELSLHQPDDEVVEAEPEDGEQVLQILERAVQLDVAVLKAVVVGDLADGGVQDTLSVHLDDVQGDGRQDRHREGLDVAGAVRATAEDLEVEAEGVVDVVDVDLQVDLDVQHPAARKDARVVDLDTDPHVADGVGVVDAPPALGVAGIAHHGLFWSQVGQERADALEALAGDLDCDGLLDHGARGDIGQRCAEQPHQGRRRTATTDSASAIQKFRMGPPAAQPPEQPLPPLPQSEQSPPT